MPRIARGNLQPGIFHVLNRGNHRQTLFQTDDDFVAFLELLAVSIAKFDVHLWGYCLMSNHWHLVAQTDSVGTLGRWMHWLCNRHVRRAHRANASLGGGHIYQGRYKSFPVQDESYLCHVLRYVEANPLRAGLVGRAQDWRWSSLSSAPLRRGLIALERPRLTAWPRDATWQATVNQDPAAERLAGLRQSVVRGTPQGDPGWIAELVARTGMESTVRARGRPRKVAEPSFEPTDERGHVSLSA